jgi:hypothetical protein
MLRNGNEELHTGRLLLHDFVGRGAVFRSFFVAKEI